MESWIRRADDPGSSVLTVTSLGMVQLCRPLGLNTTSRVIGLWKDAKTGGPFELDLPRDADGMVLSLAVDWAEEWTADGRSDDDDGVCSSYDGFAMKELSPEDASLLALIAENPTLSEESVDGLLSDVTDDDVRQVANLLAEEAPDYSRYSEVVKETADELKEWAERNREVHQHSNSARANSRSVISQSTSATHG